MLHKPDSEPIYGVRGSMPFFKNDWNYFPKKKGRVKKLSFFHTPSFLLFEIIRLQWNPFQIDRIDCSRTSSSV